MGIVDTTTNVSGALTAYFGIDFGTTNSATVGYVKGAHDSTARQIQYGDNLGRPIPSVVAINKETGEVYTGRKAWEKKMELSESCEYIPSIKTILDQNTHFNIAGRIWTPSDIACEVFKELKSAVAMRSNIEMNSAVVAIPVGFNADKRRNLRIAADRAGIQITTFISEPAAAYFANRADINSATNVAVFDWGGGTLDVCVLENRNGNIKELATGGMSIAGDRIDDKIAERIHAKIARKKGIDKGFRDMAPGDQDKLRVRAERAKCMLSEDDSATINLNAYGEYGNFNEIIDYDWFAEIIAPEINKAVACLKKTIEDSGVGIANIDAVLLVGGSSNLGPLQEILDKEFGDKLYFPDDSMWNVARGTAALAYHPGDYYSSQSVGIKLSDGGYYELLAPNTKLRDWLVETDFGVVDDTRLAKFVFSGSKDIDESSDRYKTVPTYGFLQERLHVRAFVDEDMMLNVILGSSMQEENNKRIWSYSRLKCYYRLPGLDA